MFPRNVSCKFFCPFCTTVWINCVNTVGDKLRLSGSTRNLHKFSLATEVFFFKRSHILLREQLLPLARAQGAQFYIIQSCGTGQIDDVTRMPEQLGLLEAGEILN